MGKITHILLDLDDVLVGWREGVAALFGKECPANDVWDTAVNLGVSTQAMWEAIEDSGPAFWANLEPTPWADELLDVVSKWPWSIATAYARDAACSFGKHQFCRARFGEKFEGMCILKRKWLMARPGRVLIDDRESNVYEFMNHGGTGIIFPRTYNVNRHFCNDPVKHVREVLEYTDRR